MLVTGPFEGPFALSLTGFSRYRDKPTSGASIFPSRKAA
jgi:hypothetical protein